MTDIAFFDTNVLLYMYDRRDPRKRHKSVEIFRSCLESRSLVISTQVVQEFYVSVTRKLLLSAGEARELVVDLCELPVLSVETAQILRALDLEERYRVSFWDALILSAAEASGARVLYSEDFNHGQIYGGIRLVNPFLADH